MLPAKPTKCPICMQLNKAKYPAICRIRRDLPTCIGECHNLRTCMCLRHTTCCTRLCLLVLCPCCVEYGTAQDTHTRLHEQTATKQMNSHQKSVDTQRQPRHWQAKVRLKAARTMSGHASIQATKQRERVWCNTSSADKISFHLLSGVLLSNLTSLCADMALVCEFLLTRAALIAGARWYKGNPDTEVPHTRVKDVPRAKDIA